LANSAGDEIGVGDRETIQEDNPAAEMIVQISEAPLCLSRDKFWRPVSYSGRAAE